MSSYYDNELIVYLEENEINNFTIISQVNSVIELMMKKFHFKNGRICFDSKRILKHIKSNDTNISCDVILFVNELIQENVCNANEKVIYVGDSLTENGYELCLHDLIKVIPYLVNEIPQHHYFLFSDSVKLMYVSFENDIQFGM